jgi:glycosyl transferase family 25
MTGQGFRCLYINLDRSTDRRAEVEAELVTAGVQAERVTGFDGKVSLGVEPTTYRAWRRALVGSPLNAAEIGCVESHRRALRRLVDAGDAFGVILEDDVALLPGFRDAVEELISDTAGWDVVRLEWRKFGVLADPDVSTRMGHRLVVPKNMTFGGAAFLYSRRGAALALKALDKAYFQTPDAQIGAHCGLGFRLLQLDPPVAREKAVESLLGNKPEYFGGKDRESSRRNSVQALGNGIYRAWISLRRRLSAKPNAALVRRETERLRQAVGVARRGPATHA